MFVGVGATRVRDLFEQAKANAPAIIFVDEIDAVGRHRGAGMGGGHDEREQTLNQLLVEMDGFDAKGGIILIAATNRPDILDPALLRPGRFDRQIPVGAPDLEGRAGDPGGARQGQAVRARRRPRLALAKRTVGLSGADLANVINEAALLTAREHGTRDHQRGARGVDRPGGRRAGAASGKVISEKEKKITAYHEGGHALAAWAMPDLEPVYKVTILPRGRTGGHALVVPEDDKSPDDPLRDDRPAGVRDGRPGRRGAGLPRADHRRVLRHREGHQDRPGDGHRVRHERQARRGQVRPRATTSRSSAAPTGNQPDYSLEVAQRDRRRGARADRGRAHRGLGRSSTPTGTSWTTWSSSCWRRRRSSRRDLERDLRRGREAAADHHLQRVRPAARRRTSRRSRRPAELAIERGEPWPPASRAPRAARPVGSLPGRRQQHPAGPRSSPVPGRRRLPAASARSSCRRRPAGAAASPAPGWPGPAAQGRWPAQRTGAPARRGARPTTPGRPPERPVAAARRPAASPYRTGVGTAPARPAPRRTIRRHRPAAGDPEAPRDERRPAHGTAAAADAATARRAFDQRPGRGGRPRAAARGRRGPGPGGPARTPGPGRPGLRRDVRRALHRPGRGPGHHVRREPRRADPGQGHPDVLARCEHHLVPFHGMAHVGYIPGATAGSPACPSWPGWSTSTPGARRCRSG